MYYYRMSYRLKAQTHFVINKYRFILNGKKIQLWAVLFMLIGGGGWGRLALQYYNFPFVGENVQKIFILRSDLDPDPHGSSL